MKTFYTLVGIIGLIVFVGMVTAIPVWWLWNNCLVGAVAGANEIGIFQAWGLCILVNLFSKTSVSLKS